MTRPFVCLLVGLFLTAPARAAHPPTATAKPPYERLLTGADAERAAGLEKSVVEADGRGDHAAALKAGEELLALRVRLQQADHWEAVTARVGVARLRLIAGLPAEKRVRVGEAGKLYADAEELEKKGKPEDALPLRRKHLDLCKSLYGPDHPATGSSHNDLGVTLQTVGRFAAAQEEFRAALAAARAAYGDAHPITGDALDNLGVSLDALGRHDEAFPLLVRGLSARRAALGDAHPAVAMSYSNLGYNLDERGRYAEAEPLLAQSLQIRRTALGDAHPETADSCNNLAYNLEVRGKPADAEPLFRQALAARRAAFGDEHPATVASLNNLGANLHAQGKDADAELVLRKALDLAPKALGAGHPNIARVYNSLASVLDALGRHDDAYPLYQKSLAIRRSSLGEDHPLTATGYMNLAVHLHERGRYKDAEPLLQRALATDRRAYGDIHPYVVSDRTELANNLIARDQHAEAEKHLAEAARGYETTRLASAGRGLDRSLAAARSPYPLLAAVRARAGQPTEAWEALEAGLARGLLDEEASHGAGLDPGAEVTRSGLATRLDAVQQSIGELVGAPELDATGKARLDKALADRAAVEKELGRLAAAVGRKNVVRLAAAQAALTSDGALVAWVDVTDPFGGIEEHWGCVVRAGRPPAWERLPGTGPAGRWTKEDRTLPGRLRAALARRGGDDPRALAAGLAAQRLAPLARHLADVRRLVVVPVHEMAGVPVESLTDTYVVSYAPSATVLARLRSRDRPKGDRLLALGDPTFRAPAPAPAAPLPPGGLLVTQVLPGSAAAGARLQPDDVLLKYAGTELKSAVDLSRAIAARAKEKAVPVAVWRDGKETVRDLPAGKLGVVLATDPAPQALAARRKADQMLARLRGNSWDPLPGTRVEVEGLAALVGDRAVTLVGSEASEPALDAFRRAGTLPQFRYLHLATHGRANNVRAFESAVVLAQDLLPQDLLPRPGEPFLDAQLTAAEVLEFWRLDADLVTLSACETAVGKQGGGDGPLGFAQAFLLAGSRSVCLTLWKVDDTATCLLMDRFYRNLFGKRDGLDKPMGKAESLAEAKRWLRQLPAAEALARLGALTAGVTRGERPAREQMADLPKPPKDVGKDYRPYADPRYWAAFILVGDPD